MSLRMIKDMRPLKLHIGCGNVIFPGWVNVDVFNYPGVDIVDDATKLTSIPDGSCEIIYACHILEHISRHKTGQVLSLWRNKLIDGGKLRISVPDFAKVVERYHKYNQINECIGLISGGQTNPYDHHLAIFDKNSLIQHLTLAGFSEIKEWDWRLVEHSAFDDYSQAYLPHMDKENGQLMSLNIEATKCET